MATSDTDSKRCLHRHGPCGPAPLPATAEAEVEFRARRVRWESSVCSDFCWVNQRCLQCGEMLDAEPDGSALRGRGVCSKHCFEIACWRELVPAVRATLEADAARGDVSRVTPELVMSIARAQFRLAMPWSPEWEPPMGRRKAVAG